MLTGGKPVPGYLIFPVPGNPRTQMLLVRTYIDRSGIHGIGLFADEFIPAGTMIWQLLPAFDLIISETDLAQQSRVVQEYVGKYGYLSPESQGYVICSDDARFFNHADEPNTRSISHEVTLALRDIEKGEELTCNYFEFDATAINHFRGLRDTEPVAGAIPDNPENGREAS